MVLAKLGRAILDLAWGSYTRLIRQLLWINIPQRLAALALSEKLIVICLVSCALIPHVLVFVHEYLTVWARSLVLFVLTFFFVRLSQACTHGPSYDADLVALARVLDDEGFRTVGRRAIGGTVIGRAVIGGALIGRAMVRKRFWPNKGGEAGHKVE